MDKCFIKINYKQVEKKNIIREKISRIDNFESLRKKIIEKSAKAGNEVAQYAVKNNDKFVLELVDKFAGIDSVFDDKTLDFLRGKIAESETTLVSAHITKVDKYPTWKPPQILEIFKGTLDKASKETIEEIEKDLVLENLENGNRVYIKEKKEETNLNEDIAKECHIHIFCNHCQRGNFFGFRYICAECNNYNLCEECYSNNIYTHDKEHTFIRIKKPLEPIDLDLNTYSCIFSPNRIYEKRELDVFDLNVEIINNGISDLNGCFISPVRFGKNCLGCSKTTINQEVKTGQKVKIKLSVIFFDDFMDEKQEINQYVGYFRLMTDKSIPFGDTLYVQLDIKN